MLYIIIKSLVRFACYRNARTAHCLELLVKPMTYGWPTKLTNWWLCHVSSLWWSIFPILHFPLCFPSVWLPSLSCATVPSGQPIHKKKKKGMWMGADEANSSPSSGILHFLLDFLTMHLLLMMGWGGWWLVQHGNMGKALTLYQTFNKERNTTPFS